MYQTPKKHIDQPNHVVSQSNSILSEICNDLLKIGGLERVLEKAVKILLENFNSYSVSIALLDVYHEKLEIKVYRSLTGKNTPNCFHEFKIGEGVAGLAALKRDVVYIKNTNNSQEYLGKRSYRAGIISIPMIFNGKLIGVISMRLSEDTELDKSEIGVLTVLSTIIAGSIENSRSYEKMNRQIKNLSSLFGITSLGNVQVKTTIQNMVDVVPNLLESEKVHLLIADENSHSLKTFAFAGEKKPSLIIDRSLPLDGESFSTLVFNTQKPHFINDAVHNSKILESFRKALKIESQLTVPVMASNRCLGVLHVINKFNNCFTDEDVKLASIVASRIGHKIENIQLLERSEQRRLLLDNLVRNIQEGVLMVDKSGKIVIWNNFMEEVTGVSASEAIGQNGIKLAKVLGFKEIANVIIGIIIKNKKLDNLQFERKIRAASGKDLWVRLTLSHTDVFGSKDGNIVVVVNDISHEKELIAAKNDLISTATHELRTPLTANRGYIHMLLSNDAGELNKKQTEYLGKAYAASERLSLLVEDLLSALRIDENKVSIDRIKFDLDKVVRESVDDLASKAKSKKIKVSFSKVNTEVFADRIKTKHILTNLIDNAIKYTQERGKVTISIKNSGEMITVAVRDNGVGIAPKDTTSIFDRFTRIDNPFSVKAGGTGLGLYIAKNLAEKQGGKLWLESKLKEGSTFFFTVPVRK